MSQVSSIQTLEARREFLKHRDKSGRVFTFPELEAMGCQYVLTSKDWDTAIVHGRPASEQTAPWLEIKALFEERSGGTEKQLILLRQTHSSRLIELLERPEAADLVACRDLANIEATAGKLSEVIEYEAEEVADSKSPDFSSLDLERLMSTGSLAAEQLGFALRYQGADGLLTKSPELVLATTHADCAPVIFYDRRQRLLVNIHSGWRGTLALFPLRTLEYIEAAYEVRPEDLIAVLGPMIAQADYEVEADVAVPCMAVFPPEAQVIERMSDFKYLLNIQAAIVWQLREFGLKSEQIYTVPGSTYADAQYHSYRRDGRDAFGLMSSFVSLI